MRFIRGRNLKLFPILIVVALLIALGTRGYMLLEGLSFIDALYMTIITISTVGYREVIDLSIPGKLFTIFMIIFGLGTVAYAFTGVAAFLLEGKFNEVLRRRKMENKIASLKNHYILCGAGQTGLSVIERFQKSKVPFVVIEKDKKKVTELEDQDILAVNDDATHEYVLEKCCIKHAKGLISCLSNDADNVFAVLTAREMMPNLHIVSRAIEKNSHAKLRKAGADNTISPNEIGGARMASLLLRPVVVSFLDIITRAGDIVFDLEEVTIISGSQMEGKTLRDARIPEKVGLVVLAIKKQGNDELHLNPRAEEVLQNGDKMLVMGKTDQIEVLKESCVIKSKS